MVDTTSGTVHQKLVVQIPHQCPIRINGAMKGFSFTDVIVLYDIQGNRVVPIEILDYRCSRINEYDRNAYQDICFCQMKPQSFYDSLKATIVKAKPDESYPVKLKRLLKQK